MCVERCAEADERVPEYPSTESVLCAGGGQTGEKAWNNHWSGDPAQNVVKSVGLSIDLPSENSKN